MSRRDFMSLLTLLGAQALATPVLAQPKPGPRKPAPLRAICFDLFTIFDPRSVAQAAEQIAPGRGLALWNTWKVRQFEYSWLRAAAGQYVDFEAVTSESLAYAARDLQLTLGDEAHRHLVDSYSQLQPWPDAREALLAWKKSRLKLAPLANFSPKMLRRLLEQTQLLPLFDVLISTDRAKVFKPSPAAYALGPRLLGLPRESVAFAAFGGWDAAGSKWFGLPTFWVNRLGVTAEELVAPDGTGPDFASLAAWVASRRA